VSLRVSRGRSLVYHSSGRAPALLAGGLKYEER
jgi:hypothetical protein